MTYSQSQRLQAALWKHATETLPPEAKRPAPYWTKTGSSVGPDYEFCLPPAYAAWSLLPEVRELALRLFRELEILWHAGVHGGPSNHLLSSQVQCVNALGQMIVDPERIKRAFGRILGVERALEIEPGRHLTFEYIGPTDFFNEAPSGKRIRGAHCTSVDAAFKHRAVDGATELVLLEWKYTESYRQRPPEPDKDAVRYGRYGAAVADPAGLYALEQTGTDGADRVRVFQMLPGGNHAYQKSLHRAEHRALGSTVDQVCISCCAGPTGSSPWTAHYSSTATSHHPRTSSATPTILPATARLPRRSRPRGDVACVQRPG
jgi:hypothetical protein